MNLIVLTGRLTKEPEVRYTQSGKTVCSFSIAVDRPFSGQDGKREADFFNCMLWGKQGETFGNTVHKGHKILVEGRVQISSYQAKDGSKRQSTDVVCNRFEYLERKENQQQAQSLPKVNFGDMGQMMDEEIPF
jgi:single-strand DNA-binding protein|nr:MAG TPA: Single strand binding protein [Caudoviricetes sp.]